MLTLRFKTAAVALLLAAVTLSADAQTKTDNMKYNALSQRQLNLAVCANLEAQGDLVRLDAAVRKALDEGLIVNELKEVFSHLYAYTGFPRSLNVLGVLNQVLQDRKAAGIQDNYGREWTRPAVWDNAADALAEGTRVQTALRGGSPFNYEFCPQDDYYLKAHLFGDIFAGNQLSHADREIVAVAALSGIKGVEGQLASHKAGAVALGNTQQQVDQLCKFLSDSGLTQADGAADACSGDWPKGAPNSAFAQFFIGDSFLAPIQPKNLAAGEKTVQGFSGVSFEPGCRNNWHIHHGAHQILICVSGRGWYQEWGNPAIPLKAGDIIDIPEGVKHWHGAQKDSWFQHLASHFETGGAVSNEWLEPVSDGQYDSLDAQ